MVDKKKFEQKLNRSLLLKQITASCDYFQSSFTITLDFSKTINEEKRKDYYVSLIKTLIANDNLQFVKLIYIYGKKKNRTIWKEKFDKNDLVLSESILTNNDNNDTYIVDDILAQGLSFQKRRLVKPAGKRARELAGELLELLDNDKAKSEAILREIINFNVDHSIEWYLEEAISRVIKQKRNSM